MLKRTLKRAGIGFLLGIAIGNLIAFLFDSVFGGSGPIVSQKALELFGGEVEALLIQSFLSGLIGFAGCAGMTFYEMEEWSLLRIMASHLGVVFAVFLPVSYILGWFTDLTELLIISGMMLVSYFIVWRIMCHIYKKQVDELNEIQQKFNSDKKAA